MCRYILSARTTGRAIRVRGDPIGIFENSYVFGYMEDKSVWLAAIVDPTSDVFGLPASDWGDTFLVLDCPTVSVAEGQRMLQKHTRPAVDGDVEFLSPDDADKFVKLGQHRWRFDIDGRGTLADRTEMTQNSRLTVTRIKLNSYTADRSGANENVIL